MQFEGVLPEAAPCVAYASIGLDGQVGTVVDVPPEVYRLVRLAVHLARCLYAECGGELYIILWRGGVQWTGHFHSEGGGFLGQRYNLVFLLQLVSHSQATVPRTPSRLSLPVHYRIARTSWRREDLFSCTSLRIKPTTDLNKRVRIVEMNKPPIQDCYLTPTSLAVFNHYKL